MKYVFGGATAPVSIHAPARGATGSDEVYWYRM